MNELIKIAEFTIQDPSLFVEQFELFLNNEELLKTIGDNSIEIDRPLKKVKKESPTILRLNIRGELKGVIGSITLEELPLMHFASKKLIIAEELVPVKPNLQGLGGTMPANLGGIEESKWDHGITTINAFYKVSVFFLRILPLEFIEIVKSFLSRYKQTGRLWGLIL